MRKALYNGNCRTWKTKTYLITPFITSSVKGLTEFCTKPAKKIDDTVLKAERDYVEVQATLKYYAKLLSKMANKANFVRKGKYSKQFLVSMGSPQEVYSIFGESCSRPVTADEVTEKLRHLFNVRRRQGLEKLEPDRYSYFNLPKTCPQGVYRALKQKNG